MLVAGCVVRLSVSRVVWALALLVTCLPFAAMTTLLLLPVWRWIEAQFAIEAVGHSGPADWCFEVVYLGWLGFGALVWHRRRRRDRHVGAPVA